MRSSEARPWAVNHPITPEDEAAVAALRTLAEPHKGQLRGTAAREPFDEIMGRVPPAVGVTYRADTIGGVPGWWCIPPAARPGEAILHLHGGFFSWGSARVYRNFVGQFAERAGVEAFIPDYRLAPEHPFPAGVLDIQACYQGLVDRGTRRVALVGDSAGGSLGLVLLRLASARAASGGVVPVGAVALSPTTDMTLAGPSWETRAAADPYFTRDQAVEMIRMYLGDHDLTDPLASPLFGDLAGLPPIRVHVGEDEMLLDDSLRYVERAAAAGVDARVDVWEGMPHVFLSSVGQWAAADRALEAIGSFLAERLATAEAK